MIIDQVERLLLERPLCVFTTTEVAAALELLDRKGLGGRVIRELKQLAERGVIFARTEEPAERRARCGTGPSAGKGTRAWLWSATGPVPRRTGPRPEDVT